MGFPYGHRKTTTLFAGLRMSGMVAPRVLDGPINGDWFEAYVAQLPVPKLQSGDVAIMDNLSSHKRAAIRERAETAERHCASFRPADLTLSQLRRRSHGSRPCSERLASEPSLACGVYRYDRQHRPTHRMDTSKNWA